MTQLIHKARQCLTLRRWSVFHWACLGVIVLGVVLRLLGYFTLEFWTDESIWASRLATGKPAAIRPPGFVLAAKFLGSISNTEQMLRLPALATGILSLPVMAWLCRRSGLSRAVTLGAVFVLAVHPWAVTMAKEFKPYGTELFSQIALMWLTLEVERRPSHWRIAALGTFGVLAGLFTWSAAFVLPPIFLGLSVTYLRARRWRTLASVVAAGALAAAALITSQLIRITGTSKVSGVAIRSSTRAYWGKKYDIFYIGDSLTEHLQWLAEKTAEIASFPARLSPTLEAFTDPVLAGAAWVCGLLTAVGVYALVARRSYLRLAVWAGPWVGAAVLCFQGSWPYGRFRSNLFLLAHALVLAAAGADWLLGKLQERLNLPVRMAAVLALVLLFLPVDCSQFQLKPRGAGAATSSARAALVELIDYREQHKKKKRKVPLLLDGHACASFDYYTRHHADRASLKAGRSTLLRRCLRHDIRSIRRSVRRYLRREFWYIGAKPSYAGLLSDYIGSRCRVDFERVLPGDTLLLHCTGQRPQVRNP